MRAVVITSSPNHLNRKNVLRRFRDADRALPPALKSRQSWIVGQNRAISTGRCSKIAGYSLIMPSSQMSPFFETRAAPAQPHVLLLDDDPVFDLFICIPFTTFLLTKSSFSLYG